MSQWDWKVRSYEDQRFMLETTHKGIESLCMELKAIAACGRSARIVPLSDRARASWADPDVRQRLEALAP